MEHCKASVGCRGRCAGMRGVPWGREPGRAWTSGVWRVVVVRIRAESYLEKTPLAAVQRPDRGEVREITVRPVMRTLWYSDRSWWQIRVAGIGDREKQMALREILGEKMKGYSLLLYFLGNAYSLFWGQLPPSRGVFPWHSRWGYTEARCLQNWHDRIFLWRRKRLQHVYELREKIW